MIRIFDGSVISRVDFKYLVNYPLTLVFIDDKKLRRENYSFVPWSNVAKKFDCNKDEGEDKRLGFWEMEHRAPNFAFVPSELDCLFLNEAWASFLRNEKPTPKPIVANGGLGTSEGIGRMEADRVASHGLLFP